jgi:peptidyl-prolyl cis-trans isomerase A (cyclophilin A)
MKNMITANLIASIAGALALLCAGCGEEPQPPVRTKAPEPVAKADQKAPPVPKPEVKPQRTPAPPPPPPPPSDDKPKPPPASVPKALLDPGAPEWRVTAPATFKAKFSTSKGDFTVEVTREWAPQGADRFYALVKNGYYDDVRFFRVLGNFMAQFGIHGVPAVNSVWRNASIADDPVTQSNVRGMITYAKRPGKNTRTTQIFINFKDNSMLDRDGFAPFGKVIEGMDVVDKLYNGYGEGAPRGAGPDQGRVQGEGNEYLNKDFPQLDYVKTARIIE